MTAIEFQHQMDRVRSTYTAKYYPRPRTEEIWAIVKGEQAGIVGRSITWLIQTHRSAPMIPDFLKAIEHVKAQDAQLKREYAAHKAGTPLDALEDAAKKNQTADPEFVQLCLKNLRNFQDGKISKETFVSNCDDLDVLARQLMKRPLVEY